MRYLERTKGKGKRSLGDGDDEEPGRDNKRPALADVIVETLKLDSIQRLLSSIEPILRRVVSEEIERVLTRLGHDRLAVSGRSSSNRIEGPDGGNMCLRFNTKPLPSLFTRGKVEGDHGAAIHVELMDSNTGHAVTSGPESSLKLNVVVLEGDFNSEDAQSWTVEEFDSHIVKERDGKGPLLTGDLQVTLREGVGTLGEKLSFTDNSSWVRSKKFKLGLKVASGYCDGIRIREACTEAFVVKDHRGESYQKNYPPDLDDEIWRLEKIRKDGPFHEKLNAAGINTVRDFLCLWARDSQKLRKILEMSHKMWEVLMNHAMTCALGKNLYVYYQDDTRTSGVVFNTIYELTGLIENGQYYPVDSLSEAQKIYVDSLLSKAYDNPNQAVEYVQDNNSHSLDNDQFYPAGSLSEAQKISVDPLMSEAYDNQDQAMEYAHDNNSHSLDNQLQLPKFPVFDPSGPRALDHNFLAGGSSSFSPSQFLIPNTPSHIEFPSYVESNQQLDYLTDVNHREVDLPLYTPHLSVSSFQMANPSLQHTSANTFNNWSANPNNSIDEFLLEEEIRMRTHEMLKNEEMQQMFRVYSMGGGYSSADTGEDGYVSSSYMPVPDFNYYIEGGKVVAGWLKIKAAMMWSIYVRKKAAEKQARIEEFDDK